MKSINALALAIILTACGNAVQATSDAVSNELVDKAVNQYELTFEVTYVYPATMPSYPSSDGYTLTIKDGKATTDLPFVGTSDMALFGADEVNINFTDYPVNIKHTKSKDRDILKFKAKSGVESVDVTLEIWSDGRADLTCLCINRSIMRYSGNLR